MSDPDSAMPPTTGAVSRPVNDGRPPAKKKSGAGHWALFVLRWGIAVVGVYLVVSHMSFRDQAFVILNRQTMRPEQVSLSRAVGEDATEYPIVGRAQPVPRVDVVNEPDVKTVTLADGSKVSLLGVDLVGDLSKNPKAARLLVAPSTTAAAHWVPASDVPAYVVKVPHPRDQTGPGQHGQGR